MTHSITDLTMGLVQHSTKCATTRTTTRTTGVTDEAGSGRLRLPAAGALFAMLVAVAPAAFAEPWQLDSAASTLGFASVKNGSIAEGHFFTDLTGTVDEDSSELVIDLASVDTAIPIRDERMREMLFDVADFPNAVFESDLGSDMLDELPPGESRSVDISGELAIHGVRVPVTATVLVARVGADRVIVSTQRPIVVSVDALSLSEGLESLRNVAGLTSITPSVPVTFTLAFRREAAPERRSF